MKNIEKIISEGVIGYDWDDRRIKYITFRLSKFKKLLRDIKCQD